MWEKLCFILLSTSFITTGIVHLQSKLHLTTQKVDFILRNDQSFILYNIIVTDYNTLWNYDTIFHRHETLHLFSCSQKEDEWTFSSTHANGHGRSIPLSPLYFCCYQSIQTVRCRRYHTSHRHEQTHLLHNIKSSIYPKLRWGTEYSQYDIRVSMSISTERERLDGSSLVFRQALNRAKTRMKTYY